MRQGILRAAILVVLGVLGVGLPGCIYYLNPQCTDLIRNGEETDIDCGGACGPCAIGDRCRVNGDCEESTCNAGRCTALPCANGVRDEQETDVDCGGPTCRKCPGARTCEAGSDCFSGMCSAATKTCFSLAVSFADQVPYPSGSKTYAIFTGDLDGDGDIDIAAANEQDSNISVFLNTGLRSGVFELLGAPFPTGVYPTGGAIADFNDDGIADVVTADYRGDSVSVLLGAGGGALGPKSTYATVAGSETSNLAVGDLNGDMILDVVSTNPLSSSVSMFLGRADGTLASAIDVPVGIARGSAPYSVAIGDFNRDGKNDLAIADVRSGTIVVRSGNGDGTFGPEAPYLVGGTPPYILITRDMDLDGNLDLVCANRESNNVSVLLGRGDGTFRKTLVSSTNPEGLTATGPYSIAVADFNLDGVPDVVTANYRSSNASVLLGIGNGRFDPAIDTGFTGLNAYGVATGDFNGDDKPDFATANASSNNVAVKINTSQ
jgi:hypothetical protein